MKNGKDMYIVRCTDGQGQRHILPLPLMWRDHHAMQEMQEVKQSVSMRVRFRRPLDGRSSSPAQDNAK